MAEYPPKLVQIEPTTYGSHLRLSDGRDVLIDIHPDRLNQAMIAHGSAPLAGLIEARSLDVYADTWSCTAEDWEIISTSIVASPVAKDILSDIPTIWQVFREPIALVEDLPQRVYGGLSRSLYTSHPFQFRNDPNRSGDWRYSLLSAMGGRLFKIWVNLNSQDVEIVSGILKGHFVD